LRKVAKQGGEGDVNNENNNTNVCADDDKQNKQDNNNNNNNTNNECETCVDAENDMFSVDFGDNNNTPQLREYHSASTPGADMRTAMCEIFPAGIETWDCQFGARVSCPAIFRRRSRRREIARTKPGTLFASLAYKKDSSVAFLVDSGAFKTQVPEQLKHKLRNIKTIRAIPLLTAGNVHPTCREVGYLDFKLPGRDEVYTVECLIRPGSSDMCLFALKDFENLEPPEGARDGEKQAVHVMFKQNYIKFGKKNIPLYDIHDMPMIIPEIVSGENFSGSYGSQVDVGHVNNNNSVNNNISAASCSEIAEEKANWQYVHRILAHTSDKYCERTAKKALGLPKLLKKPSRPCCECALGKMKAPRRGQGELSTGLPPPTGPGQQFHSDIFGPFSVPGLKGEKYFITLSCSFSGWGAVRCMVSKDQAGAMVESMIAEARALGLLKDETKLVIHTPVVHSDNDSVYRSKKYTERMQAAGVHLHYAASYEPRTNPYSERYGGVLLPMVRALLLEGAYPSKFWSVMVQYACWINNRLVRANGKAPIEIFALHLEKPLDFSHVHPTGVLAYWPVSKANRDDAKLGRNGVGVYLGPGSMRNQAGHLVLTEAGHVLSVAHVRVDTALKPFLRGLVSKLDSHPLTEHGLGTDLAAMLLPDGNLAGDLIGAEIQQFFPGHGTFSGRVVDIHEDVDHPGGVLFETVYSDGDGEIISYKDLQPLLVGPVVAAAAYASQQCSPTCVQVPGYALPEAFPVQASAEVTPEMLAQAERLTSFLACVSTRIWDAKDVPPGEQYPWFEIYRMKPADRKRHVAAMQAEIDKLLASGHAEWADLPPGEVAVPGVGVFRMKQHDIHAQGENLKARFCFNGKKTPAPPGGWESKANVATNAQILTVVAIATELGLKMKQIDVKSAFTQVKLPDGQSIYLRPLPGLGDPEGKGRVLKLLHHLYGHPLANAAWAQKWLQIVTSFGFKVVDRQGTVFSYKDGEKIMLMATVVDDSVVAFNDDLLFEAFVAHLKRELPIAVSDLEYICGLRVRRDLELGVTYVDQTEYIDNKAALFGVTDNGYVYSTPMENNFKLSETRPKVADPALVSEARALVGSLIYATLTRPDCKYACSVLARIVTNPTTDEIHAMRRVLQYLYDTRHTPLKFTRGGWVGPDGTKHAPNVLVVYVDASYGREEDKHSQTGFSLHLNGACIYAKSGKQSQLADSTGYSETIALHEASHWVIGYRRILANLGFLQKCPTQMFEDNSAAITFVQQGMGPKSLHYEIKYLYVHDQQKRGTLQVCKIDTKHQVADLLTKPVSWDLAQRLVSFLLGSPLKFSRGPNA
jgi:hypothetical protein